MYCRRLDSKLYLPSVDLESKFTGVVKSAKIAEPDALVWPNRKLVADERSQKRDCHHGSRRLDPRSCSTCPSDRISSSDRASEPCSHSIKKAKIPNFDTESDLHQRRSVGASGLALLVKVTLSIKY